MIEPYIICSTELFLKVIFLNKDRIMALTDGIVAIAATIMVLELAVPQTITISSLLAQGPVFYSYLVSFVLIYLAWRSHHNAFEKADVIDGKVFLANGIWLFFITLIPFTTALVGNAPSETLTEAIYVVSLILWISSFQFLDIAITKANPLAPKDEGRDNTARLVLFGGHFLALAVAFIAPIYTLIVLGVDVLIMAVGIILNSNNS